MRLVISFKQSQCTLRSCVQNQRNYLIFWDEDNNKHN